MNTAQPDPSVENDYQESNFLARCYEDLREAVYQAKKDLPRGGRRGKKAYCYSQRRNSPCVVTRKNFCFNSTK